MQEDSGNLTSAARSSAFVDAAYREFYSMFPYPWPPMTFPQLEDPDFETVMLNQSIGDFDGRTIPVDADIWVAGCGTNQAVYTALRFPKARITGSDLSPASLDIAGRNARSLNLSNLTLRQESLNDIRYEADFDYIICTGVIDHSADPGRTLANIASAMRANAVLELMVYNRFHRTFNVAAQEAVKLLAQYAGDAQSYDREMSIAKALIRSEPLAASPHAQSLLTANDSLLADALLQPVEHTYTVQSLVALADECGLELMLPCPNQFDMVSRRTWSLELNGKLLQEALKSMPDVSRWQIANLLLMDKSPMLWFYLRRRSAASQPRYEAQVNKEFLERRFVRASTQLYNFVRGPSDLQYRRASSPVPYPPKPSNTLIRDILAQATGRRTMREILDALHVDVTSDRAVSDIRTETTTSRFPYLRVA